MLSKAEQREHLTIKRQARSRQMGKEWIACKPFLQVGKALPGMYDEDSDVNLWVKKEILKWEELACALFEVHCYLKNQRKRNPIECDKKMYDLWLSWQKAFPGKSFNRFHGMFCLIRNFVHKYEMAGRVLEESNELFNGVFASVKRLPESMWGTVGQVECINART